MKRKTVRIDKSTDAFNQPIWPGSRVIFYTGNEARLKAGTVVRFFDRQYTDWRKNIAHDYRVIIKTDDEHPVESNIGNQLCMVLSQYE